VHLNDPVYEYRPHFLIDVALVLHVMWRWQILHLRLQQVLADLSCMLSHHLRVTNVLLIHFTSTLLRNLRCSNLPEVLESLPHRLNRLLLGLLPRVVVLVLFRVIHEHIFNSEWMHHKWLLLWQHVRRSNLELMLLLLIRLLLLLLLLLWNLNLLLLLLVVH